VRWRAEQYLGDVAFLLNNCHVRCDIAVLAGQHTRKDPDWEVVFRLVLDEMRGGARVEADRIGVSFESHSSSHANRHPSNGRL